MMTASEIESLIKAYIGNSLSRKPIDGLLLESNLFAEGYLDSIGIMKLIAHIEAQLETKIPPKDLVPRNFMTIQAMTAYLQSR